MRGMAGLGEQRRLRGLLVWQLLSQTDDCITERVPCRKSDFINTLRNHNVLIKFCSPPRR